MRTRAPLRGGSSLGGFSRRRGLRRQSAAGCRETVLRQHRGHRLVTDRPSLHPAAHAARPRQPQLLLRPNHHARKQVRTANTHPACQRAPPSKHAPGSARARGSRSAPCTDGACSRLAAGAPATLGACLLRMPVWRTQAQAADTQWQRQRGVRRQVNLCGNGGEALAGAAGQPGSCCCCAGRLRSLCGCCCCCCWGGCHISAQLSTCRIMPLTWQDDLPLGGRGSGVIRLQHLRV